MKRRSGLWMEIGVNLALLTVAVLMLDVAVFLLASRSSLTGASAALADVTAEVIAAQLTAAGPDKYEQIVEAHRRAGLGDLAVLSSGGVVLAGEHQQSSGETRSVFATRSRQIKETATAIEVVAPVGGPGIPVAALWMRLPVAAVAGPAWAVIAGHVLFSGAVIVVFGVAMFRRNVVTPLARLGEATRRIAAGERGVVASEAAAAEIADLARALNSMARDLERFRDGTAAQVASLEAANDALRAAQEALIRSEKLASVGRLGAGLAHELGNPLTAVRGYLDLLTSGVADAPLRAELTSRAAAEVERMHALLRAMLDFSRESTRTVAELPVGELLQEAVRTVRLQSAFRETVLEVELVGEPVARVESARIHQVLVNLLLNAADAGARRIRLSATMAAGMVVVRCEDDGAGITPEDLPRVFEPFFTTRAPGSGTGLGLAVSWRIIEQHGGTFTVSSVPSEKTVFVFTLPAVGMTGPTGVLIDEPSHRA